MARRLAISTEFKGFDKMSKPLSNINKKLERIDRRLKRTKDTSKKTEQSFTKSFAKMAAGVAAFLVAFRGITLLKDGLFASTQAASDLFEEQQKLNQVFESVTTPANAMRDNLVTAYNFSKKEATELLGATGDLLVGFGFQEKKALELAGSVQELAADLASFNNLEGGAKRASVALTKALLGEIESAKSLGIVIKQAAVNAILLAKGQSKLKGEALLAATAQARFDIALKQSSKAIGDVARNQGTYASNVRLMEARMEDFSGEIGEAFLPVMNALLGEFLKGVGVVRAFTKVNKEAISSAFLTGVQFAIKGLSILLQVTGFVTRAFIVAAIGGNNMAFLVLSGIASMLEAFPKIPKIVTKIFGFVVNVVAGAFTKIANITASVISFFDEDFANSIKAGTKQIDKMADDFVKSFQASEDAGLKMAKGIRESADAASKRADALANTFFKIPDLVGKATDGLDDFSTRLESLKGSSGQKNQTVIETSTNDPVGASTPSAAVTSTAKMKGEINVNFNNKPDNVDVVRPEAETDTGLVLGGSG